MSPHKNKHKYFLIGVTSLLLKLLSTKSVSALEPEIIYDYQVADQSQSKVSSEWPANSNRTWLLTGTMDGEIEKKYFGWSDVDKARYGTGTNDGEKLAVYIKNLNINPNNYNDLRIKLDYFERAENAATQIHFNKLRFYISDSTDENGNWYGPYILSEIIPTGFYRRASGTTDYNFDLVSEKISLPANSLIRQIKIIPYHNMEKSGGIFFLSEVSVEGYKSETYSRPKEYEPFNSKEASDFIIRRMYDLATIKWVPEVDAYGSMSGSYEQEAVHVYAGQTYYGIPYGQANDVSLERFVSFLNDETYIGPTEKEHFSTIDCSSSIADAASTFIPFQLTHSGPEDYLWNGIETYILGSLQASSEEASEGRDTDYYKQTYSEQEIYEAYALTKKGDVIDHYVSPKPLHTRLITGDTVVVRNSDGTINPNESYVISTEITGVTPRPYSSDIYPGVAWTPNPDLTDLESLDDIRGKTTTWYINRKYSFANLYNSNPIYIPLRFKQMEDDKVEKISAKVINPNTIDNLGDGLKGTLVSNYKISSVKYVIKTNEEVKEFIEYPERNHSAQIGVIHNMYSIYHFASDELQEHIENLDIENDTIDITIIASSGAKEAVALELRNYEPDTIIPETEEPIAIQDEDDLSSVPDVPNTGDLFRNGQGELKISNIVFSVIVGISMICVISIISKNTARKINIRRFDD